jgi:FixJ family two-component response regulator
VTNTISTSILITVVDDDESIRDALKGFLRSAGFAAEIFSSAADLLGSNVLDRTSCLIVDVHMPVMTGLELQCRLSNAQSRIPMIFITAGDDPAARAQALQAGAVDFLRKPFAADTLLDAIHTALANTGDT